jgi:hypothetical protein
MFFNNLADAAAEAEPGTLLWAAAGALLLLAIWSAFAEHRRRRRRNLDSPGWVPWDLVHILAFLGAVIAAALALKT